MPAQANTLHVAATNGRWKAFAVDLPLDAAETQELPFQLLAEQTPAPVAGQLRDADDKPVPNITVRLTPPANDPNNSSRFAQLTNYDTTIDAVA
ncbi:MAG TPA: hypothetical protein VH253_01195 [Phycisphaerae bacterium]|nr:hypothetical protein [Phycisphaerae bacterium]